MFCGGFVCLGAGRLRRAGSTLPSGVSSGAATLNGQRGCSADVAGRWAWQWRELGTTSWSSGGTSAFDCPPDQNRGVPGYAVEPPADVAQRSGSAA